METIEKIMARDYEQELANINNALAFDEEIRAEGEDPNKVAEDVRQIIRDAIERYYGTEMLKR